MSTASDAWHEGKRRRDEALALVEIQRMMLVLHGRRALLLRLLIEGFASADDVRDVVELPPGVSPRVFGAVPGPLAKARVIRHAGFTTTRRANAHARPLTRWELADRDAALKWLADNPEPTPAATASQTTLWALEDPPLKQKSSTGPAVEQRR